MTENRQLPRIPKIPFAPEEGWLTLFLVLAMAVIAGWSLDDAGWVLGNTKWTDFLAWAGAIGVLVGFVGAKAGWNRWVAHLIGATFGALIVPVLVGRVLLPDAGPGAQFAATAASSIHAWNDLVVDALPTTRQTGHYLLVFGLLCWGTGQFAASAVFRHRRPLSAVVVIGTILVGNMAATVDDQLGYLILFSIAALFLLIRLHALDEQTTWARRRIGDPAAVGSIYLRGGSVFILIAVVGAFGLTATARSDPLAGAWEDVKPWLLDVTTAVQRFLPNGGGGRSLGVVQFGPNAPIQNVWSPASGLAMTIRRTPGDDRPYYWRAVAYDRFNLYGWGWTDSHRTQRPPGDPLLAETPDEPRKDGTTEVTFTVIPESNRGPYIVSPVTPVSIDRDSDVLGLGAEGFFEAIEVNGNDPYVLTAAVPVFGDATPGGITGNLLRVAGVEYPDEVRARYIPLEPAAVGPAAQKILDDILADLEEDPNRSDNPYDVADALVTELHSARFHYDTDVLDVDCGNLSATECFAVSKRGYCQHYASLMAVILRAHHIPARFVQGFLPGIVDPLTGIEEVQSSDAHAWVEVYFPGYGWVMFDPTGGPTAGTAEPIPSGRPVASRPPTPSASIGPRGSDDQEGPDPRRSNNVGVTGTGRDGGIGPGGYILVSMLLITIVGFLAFIAWQRGPRGPTTPEGAYAGVARLAARFGFGPRPTQTAYEYATALGDVLPTIRPELQTVATAKVEVAYGRRDLGDDRIRAVRESYRRLRVGLLRLLFRRRGRR